MKNQPKHFFLSMFLMGLLTFSASAQNIYNIMNFGAVNSKGTNSQKAIQQAIDSCASQGGGTVHVPAGEFSTNTINLKSNVSLYLDNGARLYAIPDINLYKNSKEGAEDSGASFVPALILAKNVKNIAILGQGHIIGEPNYVTKKVTWNDEWPGWLDNARKSGVEMNQLFVDDPKISLVYITDCENITIKDVSIIDSPYWSCHIQWSNEVMINNVTITSSLEKGVNSDGLDIDGCSNVTVSDCIIQTGDDAICLKTTRQGGRTENCEFITITNNVVSSTSCALKLGTESFGDFKNIIFSNNVIKNSNRGLGIFVRDGALVENVIFTDITVECKRKPFYWWGDGDAFQFVVLKRNPDSKVGKIRNLTIKNIMGSVQGTSVIRGLENQEIENVTLSNINLKMYAEDLKDKRADYGIRVENAQDVRLNNVALSWSDDKQEEKWKSALFLKDLNNFTVERLRGKNPKQNKDLPLVEAENVKQGYFINNIVSDPIPVFAGFKGNKTDHIYFGNNFLPKGTKLFQAGFPWEGKVFAEAGK